MLKKIKTMMNKQMRIIKMIEYDLLIWFLIFHYAKFDKAVKGPFYIETYDIGLKATFVSLAHIGCSERY